MSLFKHKVVAKAATILTSAATVLSMSGVMYLAPVASAVAPADYGLTEGNMISASSSNDPDIYIVNDWGYKRLFLNPAIFNMYGHLTGGWALVKNVSTATRDAFGTSGLFRNCETGEQAVWAVEVTGEDTGVFHHVVLTGDQAVAQDSNFFKKVFCINSNEANWYPKGSDYTSLGQVPDYSRSGSPTPTPSTSGFNMNGTTQGSVEDFQLGSPDDTEALEGQSNVEIYAVDAITANDGPVLVQSVDVWFAQSDAVTASNKPWDYFSSVRLMANGVTVATMNSGSSADWSDVTDGTLNLVANGTDNEYRMRFSNLNVVLPSDATTVLSAAVSVVNTIDTADQDAVWNVELGDVRVRDESGLTLQLAANALTGANTTELEDSFTVGGADVAGLEVRDAANAVDATVIQVSQSSDTNGVAIYSFTIEETEGVAVDIDELTLNFAALSSASVAIAENIIFARARVMEGSTQRGGDETVSSVGSASFDNMGIHLAGDQKKTFTVQVDLNDNGGGTSAVNTYDEGATISVAVDDDTMVFEDVNGNDEADINEDVSAVSNTHELRSEGVRLAFTSASISSVSGISGSSDVATAKIKFTATAFGSDAYLDNTAPASSSGSTYVDGATQYTLTNEASATGAATLQADDSISGEGTNGYKVQDGTTRAFTLTVAVTTTSTAGIFVDASLVNLHYALTDIDGDLGYTFNLGAYKTGQVFIQKHP